MYIYFCSSYREAYISINNFYIRKALCKIRISAHQLKIEKDRYSKHYIERKNRICDYCRLHQTEDETHFIIKCPLYNLSREILFAEINKLCPNFMLLSDEQKFQWLFINENFTILNLLGRYIIDCTEQRRVNDTVKS